MHDYICVVCFEEVKTFGTSPSLTLLSQDRPQVILNCGHRYHLDCLTNTFICRKRTTCPVCRKEQPGEWHRLISPGHTYFSDDFEWNQSVEDFFSDGEEDSDDVMEIAIDIEDNEDSFESDNQIYRRENFISPYLDEVDDIGHSSNEIIVSNDSSSWNMIENINLEYLSKLGRQYLKDIHEETKKLEDERKHDIEDGWENGYIESIEDRLTILRKKQTDLNEIIQWAQAMENSQYIDNIEEQHESIQMALAFVYEYMKQTQEELNRLQDQGSMNISCIGSKEICLNRRIGRLNCISQELQRIIER